MAKHSEGEGSNRPACAACRHQRRKCKEDCVLAPFFPTDKTQDYLAVHKVFGFSNMTKMLNNLDEQGRKHAVMSFEWEALMWKQDPVLGPLGAYKNVCDILSNLLNQQTVPSSEPKLMGMTQDLSVFNNSNNEALAVPNNGVPALSNNWAPSAPNYDSGQTSSSGYNEKGLVSHSYVNSFGDILGNEMEDPEVLNCVPAPAEALRQMSSLLQPNYFPIQENQSLRSFALPLPDIIPSSAMDQASQIRGFQYYNDNRINRQRGIQRGGQGTEGNAENIYSGQSGVYNGLGQGRGISQRGGAGQAQQDHGTVILVEKSVMAVNPDHAMAQNRVRSQITNFQHFFYHPLSGRHSRIQQESHHGF